MISSRRAERIDCMAWAPRAWELQNVDALGLREAAFAAVDKGDVVIIELDGLPLVMSGITVLWPGVAQLWMIGTEQLEGIHDYPTLRDLMIEAIQQIDDAVQTRAIRRLHVLARAEIRAHVRFARAVGFVGEGHRLEDFGPDGEDMLVLRWRKPKWLD